tara:strand:+ start:320 stop:586 length:267 start_codon:yes stop_codon:yes gene_type:complete
MTKVEKSDEPIGWLIDPHKKWAIHFDFKKVSNEKISSDFTIDMWGVANGKPMQFKSRRKVTKQEMQKNWKQLISSNWVEFVFEKNQIA